MYKKIIVVLSLLVVAQLNVMDIEGQSSIPGIIDECQVGFVAFTVEWSNDDDYILCVDEESGAVLIETSTYTVHSIYPHKDILNARFNQTTTQVMTWGRDGYIRLWDIGNTIPILELYEGGFFPVPKWNHDESFIASTDPNFTGTRIWDASSGLLLLETNLGSGVETDQGSNPWHPTKNLLLMSRQSQVELWDIDQRRSVAEWEAPSMTFTFPSWNVSGDLIAFWDDPLIILDETLKEVNRFDTDVPWGTWGSQGLLLMPTEDKGYVWNPYSGDIILEIDDIDLGTGLLWHPDGNRFAFWRGNDTFQIWSIEGPIVSFQNDSLPTEAFGNHGRWSYDGKYFIYFTLDRKAMIVDATTGKTLVEVEHNPVDESEQNEVYVGGMLNHSGDKLATITRYNLIIHDIN